MPTGTTTFQLKVKPPADAGDDDYSIFIVKGINHNNNTFKHTVSAKTIVSLPKPDLSVRADTGIDNICVLTDDPCHNDVFNLSLNVYNLGDIPVSNFDVNFKLSTVGQEALIGSIVVTDTLEPDAYINVQYPWTAIEGTHSLCIHVDENDKIREKDEQGNNEVGLICDVGPARPKSIILSMDVDPTSCMPEDEFTVSGKAKYNPEYGSVPVKDTNVNIKIKETGKTFSTKTKTNGEFTKVCTAPKDADTYTIQVSISDGELSAAANKYLTVALFQVTVLVTPGTILTGDAATLTGRVTDSDYGVADADVTIKLFDINDNEDVNVDTKTDMDGFYSKQVTPTTVTEYSEFKVEVTASKGDIGGTQESKLFVDIDTDSDLIGNLIDTDDDGDNYPDNVEEPYGYDPLDVNDVPYPVADAGADQTVDEGAEVSFDGGQSYSPVGLPLTFEWDFGVDSEEATSDSTTPKYTYNADQEYTVTLKVTDEYKGSDTETITITVTDLGPNAKITGQTSGEEDINLQFSGEQSTSSPDKIKKYEWDWDGDGNYDEETTTASASHAWDKSDAYTVTLRITDSDGSTSTDELNVIITAKITPGSGGDSSKTAGDNTSILIAIAVVIVAIILVAMFMLMRRKKPTETPPSDERVAGNINAQSSRRPTTQFADASIKPAMAPPGTTPPQQMSTPVQQVSALPPSKLPETPPQQKQRDWNWNFNE
jgi:PKD repeat protein